MQFIVGRQNDRVLVPTTGKPRMPLENLGHELGDDVLIAGNRSRTADRFQRLAPLELLAQVDEVCGIRFRG